MRKAEFGFRGTPLREQLVAAILRGEKTATAGLVVDNDDEGVALIEITAVSALRIGDCDLAFARDEGEGFETVAEWRVAHDRYWRGYADEIREYLGDPNWDVTDDTEFVAERFRLVEVI